MKRIFQTKAAKYLGFCTLLFVGCTSNLVEQPNFATPDSFFRNESEVTAAINGVYRPLNQQWFNTYYNRSVFDCALGITGGYEKGPQYYKQGAYVSGDEYIIAYWRDNYDGINRANLLMEKLPTVPETAISAEVRKRINGEVHFLRALYLYQLYIYFENIAVPTESTKDINTFPSNEGGKAKALATMEADLKVAETDLSETDRTGRPTKWAAKTLLAKVYLEAGKWQPAADKAKEVIDQSGLTLFAEFGDNFDPAKENQGERLFEVQNNFERSPDNYNNMHAHYTPTDWDGGDPNTLELGDSTTAAGWADAWIVGDTKLRALFDNGDKRIRTTFMEQYRSKNVGRAVVRYDPAAKSPFVAPKSNERTFNNVIIQKFIEYNTGSWQNTKKNYMILRLADAYLAHSEACANGANGDATFGINAIRQRAGLSPVTATGAALKDAIFWEWLREFAGEAWAFPTARRFNKTAEVIKQFTGRTVDNNKFRLLPIPLVETDANKNIKQNEGWQ